MAKRVISVTRKGVVDSGPVGDTFADAADFKIDSESIFVLRGGQVFNSSVSVGAATTGSLTKYDYAGLVTGPGQINLPSDPEIGQTHKIICLNTSAVIVSGSGNNIIVAGSPVATETFSGTTGDYKEYVYISSTTGWLSGKSI